MTQQQALDILKTGANVFLTGEPGSGKTYTINTYVNWLKRHRIEPAITASTGIAATHIGGTTIHSFSGVWVADSLSDFDVDRIASIQKIYDRISDTQVLIIDEISMLDSAKLDMVDMVFREVRRSEMPFGGIQVVLVGDFFQLPPVTRGTTEKSFAFESSVWAQAAPVTCYLTEQHRQSDHAFIELLTAIRRNSINESHHEQLAARRSDASQVREKITRLFSHNADVDRINNIELAKLPGEVWSFAMQSRGRKSIIEQLIRGCLSPENLQLKKESTVMFTKNSPTGRFVNGTTGIVVGFEDENGYPIVRTKDGVRITVSPMKWSVEDRGKILASIEQIPLRLAWAMTVHKSQGVTMDEAVVDLSGAFEYGQGYVALSRVRSLDGLHLQGINARAFLVHPKILAKDGEFQTASDVAIEKLAEMTDLPNLHEAFIRACGGDIKEIEIVEAVYKKPVGSKWQDTVELIRSGKGISEVARLRSRTDGTIMNHLEEAKGLGKLEVSDLAHLSAGKEPLIVEIQKAFTTIEPTKLRPVFDHFDGRYSFDDIRLARLLS